MTSAPTLSLFHKILLLTEDLGDISLNDLEQFGSTRQTLGALGRLEGLKLIKREKNTNTYRISLTEKGESLLDDILSYLPSETSEWNGKWHIILFDVPESHRSVRQMFRLKLLDLGARMLQSSVWITTTPYPIQKFLEIVNNSEFKSAVHIFEASHNESNHIDVNRIWELDTLEQEYKSLFTSFDKTLKTLEKQDNPSFVAKCMIVQLALLCRKDPRLPEPYMPKDWIGYKAKDWFLKIRTYCE